jgi:hypothetical protein
MRRCVTGSPIRAANPVPQYQNGATPTYLQSDIAAYWLPEGPGPVIVS